MDANKEIARQSCWSLVVFVLGIALGGVGTYLVTTRVQAARAAGHARTLRPIPWPCLRAI